ncbi:hypothetical protein [Emticicia sp.]|uniref:hypothetical protein n=1 Tax=Emticicia sp. TaxID=1930953 RepID=UPI0037508EA9
MDNRKGNISPGYLQAQLKTAKTIVLTKNDLLERLKVFGLRGNDDYELYSNIDLADDSPLVTNKVWLGLKEFAYYDVKTVLQISLVHYNANLKRLQKQILKTGEIIYVK